jgi:hypothetical protein
VNPNGKRPVPLGMKFRLPVGSPASADSLMLSSFAPDSAGLQEHQSQRQTRVNATVTIPAAHWILQQ